MGINEDGELEQAYKTQKDLNKINGFLHRLANMSKLSNKKFVNDNGLLERELQKVTKTSELKEKEMREQLTELRTENERQQKIIGQNLNMTPEAKIEATMQHEITRL